MCNVIKYLITQVKCMKLLTTLPSSTNIQNNDTGKYIIMCMSRHNLLELIKERILLIIQEVLLHQSSCSSQNGLYYFIMYGIGFLIPRTSIQFCIIFNQCQQIICAPLFVCKSNLSQCFFRTYIFQNFPVWGNKVGVFLSKWMTIIYVPCWTDDLHVLCTIYNGGPFQPVDVNLFPPCKYVCDYNVHAHICTAWYGFEHSLGIAVIAVRGSAHFTADLWSLESSFSRFHCKEKMKGGI